MKKQNFDIVEFLERWGKIAGLIATIVSAILFVSHSFVQSIVLVIVGWALILSWLISITRNHSTKQQFKHRAYLGILILTIVVVGWVTYGIQEEAKKYVFPENAGTLPNAEYAGLSVYVDSWSSNGDWKILTHSIDHTANIQQIDQTWIGESVNLVGDIAVLRLYVKGQSDEDQIQIDNKIPVKLISYSPVITPIDVYLPMQGGQGSAEAYFFLLNFPQQKSATSEQFYEATLNPDIQKLSQELTKDNNKEWPSEIQRAISETNKQVPLPDIFTLNPSERILFSVALVFNTPGIYEIEPGIEYLYKGKKSIAWVKPSIKIQVPAGYYKWQELGNKQDKVIVRLAENCQFEEKTGYKCENTLAAGNDVSPTPKSQPGIVGSKIFSTEQKDSNGVTEFIITQNVFDTDFLPQSPIIWSSTQQMFAVLNKEGAYLFDFANMNSAKLFPHLEPERAMFSHNGEFLLTGARDGTIKMWRTSDGILLHDLESHLLRVSAIAISDDDSLIATASEDTTLHISRVSDGKLLY